MARTRQPTQDTDTTSRSADQSSAPWGGLDNSFMNMLLGSGGVAGAAGREGAVQSMLSSAYNLGNTAQQGNYNGSIFRNTNSAYTSGVYDSTRSTGGNGMRYNAGGTQGQQLNYNSPTFNESLGEMHAYQSPTNPTGMANRTMIESNYQATVNSAGRGGVADVSALAAAENMSGALTAPKGNSSGPWYYRLAGESPYSMPQQVGKGATDAGASAMRVPSATGGNQIDIIPRNTNASQITPLEMTPFDAHGRPMASSPATGVNPMVADTSPHTNGMLEAPAGEGMRGSSVRYGAAGGGLMSLGTDLYRMAQGDDIGLGQVALDTGIGTAAGAGSGLAMDAMMARGASMRGASGALGGVLEGGMSLWNNANAYNNGEIDGGHAAANVVVDTGVGIGAGIAGAQLGALIGSVIPGAGTAVGAGIGFVGGLVGSWLVHELVNGTGIGDWAKENLGDAFNAIGEGAGAAWDGAKELGGEAWEGLKGAGGALADGAGAAWDGAKELGGQAWDGAKELGGQAWDGVKGAGGAIADGAGAAWEGAKDLGGQAWDGVKGAGSAIADAGSAAWDFATSW